MAEMESYDTLGFQKLLAEERTRTEQHKINYQTLKLDHQRLQEECNNLRLELSQSAERRDKNDDSERAKAERDLAAAKAMIEELKSRVMTPHRLELIKLRHQEEVESKLAERISRADDETEHYRNEFNRLRYDFGFLKAEYEHERIEFERRIEEMKLRYESDIKMLNDRNETLEKRKVSDGGRNAELVVSLQKDNLRLTQQVKGLMSELKEAHDQWDQIGTETSAKQRQQVQQMAEIAAKLKSIELEKSAARERCDKLQRDLQLSVDEASNVRTRLSESGAEVYRLRLKFEDSERSSKIEIVNCKTEMAKRQAEFERQHSNLQQIVKDLKSELEKARLEVEGRSRGMADKETEFEKRINAIREDEWTKTSRIEAEKFDLEVKYQEVEQKLLEANGKIEVEVNKGKEKLRDSQEANRLLEMEVLSLRTKLDGHRKLGVEADELKQENDALKAQIVKLRFERRTIAEVEEASIARNKTLNEALECAKREIEERDAKEERLRTEEERTFLAKEVNWQKAKLDLQRKIDRLERSVKELKHEVDLRAKSHKRKTNQYTRLITKLRNKIQILNAKVEELVIEREALRNWVPHDVHNVVKKRLHDLQLRHDEFKKLLQTHHLFGGDVASSYSSILPFDGLTSVWLISQQEQSLKGVQDRLRQLYGAQSQQLDQLTELKGTSPDG